MIQNLSRDSRSRENRSRDTSSNSSGWAWLNHSDQVRSLRVTEWSAEPKTFSFYAPDFARTAQEPWLCGEAHTLSLKAQALPPVVEVLAPSPKEFEALHADILKEEQSGTFEKVVPIVSTTVKFAQPLTAGMFAGSLVPLLHQYSYGFEFAGEGLCGITPEILFSVKKGELQTMALAGTALADGPSLFEDPKECLEHRLVVEHIRAELRDLGTVDTGATIERVYGPLKHLLTPMQMKVPPDINFLYLVNRLHPTAALGGWPRGPALAWLSAQPFHVTRRRFGAPFGHWDRSTGEMVCVVAIRGLQWLDATAQLGTGCGVVRGSVATREWKELLLKREAVCRLLGLSL